MPPSLVPRRSFRTRVLLDRCADGVRAGVSLCRGEVIGHVGTSGNASPAAPHLHFAVFRLGPERRWWKGEAVNPFGALH